MLSPPSFDDAEAFAHSFCSFRLIVSVRKPKTKALLATSVTLSAASFILSAFSLVQNMDGTLPSNRSMPRLNRIKTHSPALAMKKHIAHARILYFGKQIGQACVLEMIQFLAGDEMNEDVKTIES